MRLLDSAYLTEFDFELVGCRKSYFTINFFNDSKKEEEKNPIIKKNIEIFTINSLKNFFLRLLAQYADER